MLLPGASATVPEPGELAEFVSKIMMDGAAIGCLVRITESGLCVTAAHCLVDHGMFLKGSTAFGGTLQLAGSSPYRDIMFVQGRVLLPNSSSSSSHPYSGPSPICIVPE